MNKGLFKHVAAFQVFHNMICGVLFVSALSHISCENGQLGRAIPHFRSGQCGNRE